MELGISEMKLGISIVLRSQFPKTCCILFDNTIEEGDISARTVADPYSQSVIKSCRRSVSKRFGVR